MVDQGTGFHIPMWEPCIAFLATNLGLTLLQPSEEWTKRNVTSFKQEEQKDKRMNWWNYFHITKPRRSFHFWGNKRIFKRHSCSWNNSYPISESTYGLKIQLQNNLSQCLLISLATITALAIKADVREGFNIPECRFCVMAPVNWGPGEQLCEAGALALCVRSTYLGQEDQWGELQRLRRKAMWHWRYT